MTAMAAALNEAGFQQHLKPFNNNRTHQKTNRSSFDLKAEVRSILKDPDNYKCGHLTDNQATLVFRTAYSSK